MGKLSKKQYLKNKNAILMLKNSDTMCEGVKNKYRIIQKTKNLLFS